MLLITQVAWYGVELLQRTKITNFGSYAIESELNREKLKNACSGLDYGRLWLDVWWCSYHHDTLLNPLKYSGYKANTFYLIWHYKIFLFCSQVFLQISYVSWKSSEYSLPSLSDGFLKEEATYLLRATKQNLIYYLDEIHSSKSKLPEDWTSTYTWDISLAVRHFLKVTFPSSHSEAYLRGTLSSSVTKHFKWNTTTNTTLLFALNFVILVRLHFVPHQWDPLLPVAFFRAQILWNVHKTEQKSWLWIEAGLPIMVEVTDCY